MRNQVKEAIKPTTVSIIQDHIPKYREPFFHQLAILGKQANVEYVVYKNASHDTNIAFSFPVENLKILRIKRPFLINIHLHVKKVLKNDIIILEQALHNPLLLFRTLRKKRTTTVLFWGHGGYWTRKVSNIQKQILISLIRRSNHILIYNEEGAIRLIEEEIHLSNISVLRNSTDTKSIRSKIDGMSYEEHNKWKLALGINSSKIGCFIGEFSRAKNLVFLTKALIEIHNQIPDFQFLFFGYGKSISVIESITKKYSWIKFCGEADDLAKAHLAKADVLILNPGRVGLIAVDSIAMKAPLITRDLKWTHAPEIDYLKNGVSFIMTDDSVAEYAAGVVKLIENPELKEKLSGELGKLQSKYSIEAMAENFHSAVMKFL